jgi:hypothetical protein
MWRHYFTNQKISCVPNIPFCLWTRLVSLDTVQNHRSVENMSPCTSTSSISLKSQEFLATFCKDAKIVVHIENVGSTRHHIHIYIYNCKCVKYV